MRLVEGHVEDDCMVPIDAFFGLFVASFRKSLVGKLLLELSNAFLSISGILVVVGRIADYNIVVNFEGKGFLEIGP